MIYPYCILFKDKFSLCWDLARFLLDESVTFKKCVEISIAMVTANNDYSLIRSKCRKYQVSKAAQIQTAKKE